MRWASVALVSALLFGCGSAAEPREPNTAANVDSDADGQEEPETSDDRSEETNAAADSVPRKCRKKNKKRCLPPKRWVARLCNDVYPDVALHMFQAKTPWRRLYMLQNAEPFNASGGASLMGEKLQRGEEVIALRRRKPKDGVQMSDTSGYDVLRWNGACSTIHDGEFTTRKPEDIGHARVEWRELSLEVRQALEADPEIQRAYEARRKACRGRVLGVVSADCERYDREFVDVVVRYVRSGGKLPAPQKVP